MISDFVVSKLTKRTTRLTFNAESFEDERILSTLLEVIEGKGSIIASSKRRKMKFRFGKPSERMQSK